MSEKSRAGIFTNVSRFVEVNRECSIVSDIRTHCCKKPSNTGSDGRQCISHSDREMILPSLASARLATMQSGPDPWVSPQWRPRSIKTDRYRGFYRPRHTQSAAMTLISTADRHHGLLHPRGCSSRLHESVRVHPTRMTSTTARKSQ